MAGPSDPLRGTAGVGAAGGRRPGGRWRAFAANRPALAALGLAAIIAALAVVGPRLYRVKPFEIVGAPMTPPGGEHPLGTDYLGRDVLAGLVHGAGVTILVGLAAAACTVTIGVAIGMCAGFHGDRVERSLMRVTEFFQVLPPLLFAMVLITLFSPRVTTIILAIGVVSWAGIARLTRVQVLKVRSLDFVTAERAMGAGNARIILRTILPNACPPLIVAAALSVGTAILFEAGLSFLGLGDPNTMSWGYMVGASRDYIRDTWWAVTFPGVAIFATVLSVTLIGDGLNDALDPLARTVSGWANAPDAPRT